MMTWRVPCEGRPQSCTNQSLNTRPRQVERLTTTWYGTGLALLSGATAVSPFPPFPLSKSPPLPFSPLFPVPPSLSPNELHLPASFEYIDKSANRHLFCVEIRDCRPLLKETGWLGAGFITVCLETRWLGPNTWFLCAGSNLYILVACLHWWVMRSGF